MEYTYQARDEKGMMRTGTVVAINEASAFDILSGHGLIVIKIFPLTKVSLLQSLDILDWISAKDIVLFSRQLATLINAKVPIVQALKILRMQVSSKRLQNIIAEISSKVESGNSLSEAISQYPNIFSNLYVSLVHAGELSGTLDESLSYLATQLEKDYELRSKVIGAMIYPAFIISALLVVGILMFIFVLPPLVSILQEAQVDLPITTKILIAATNIIQHFWWLLLLALTGLAIGLRVYIRTYSGRLMIDYFKIKSPIFGKLFVKIYMSRFARNLSTLLAGGIPVVKALDAVADIVGNQVYKEIILDASQKVRNGKSISSALTEDPEFPPIVSQMIQIGESTGELQQILDKLASFYEKEVEGVLKILTTLIEPIIMLILGMAVAVMVAGILLPIYNLASAA
ncbi:MAG: type II secretion system F family protein [Candidatus Doudnabacteria bacterium]|nr:type II secretion system F family protein [Candidatus Doudnabacteria bacterium]